MKREPIPSHILKLDGGNASLIAKRVGKSPATIRKWMRDGIPVSAREVCKAAVKRHTAAIKSAKTRAKKAKPIARRTSKKRKAAEPTGIPLTARDLIERPYQQSLARMFAKQIAGLKELEVRRKQAWPLRKRFGSDPAGRDFLMLLVETEDEIWDWFVQQANDLGLTLHDARQSFFSPKIR
jgi:hypothetical protein